MRNSLVSIIIPCYNAEKWLPDTINSCLSQTYRPIEIIVVDDGSTDDSIDIVENMLELGSLPYDILRCENGGPSRARNKGLEVARGDWIQFLDADDVLLPDKIQRQMSVATQLPNQYAVIFSKWRNLQCVDGRWQPFGAVRRPDLADLPSDLIRSDNFLQVGSYLISSSWLKKIGGFDESMWLIEDVNLLLRIAIAGGQFHFVDTETPVFYYRQLETSLSKGKQIEFTRACLKNADLVRQWYNDGMSDRVRSTLIDAYYLVARSSYKLDQRTFEVAYQRLKQLSLNGNFIPQKPFHLRLVSQIFGYRNAEYIAEKYRRIKSLFKRGS